VARSLVSGVLVDLPAGHLAVVLSSTTRPEPGSPRAAASSRANRTGPSAVEEVVAAEAPDVDHRHVDAAGRGHPQALDAAR
jgi:hypothetical protein